MVLPLAMTVAKVLDMALANVIAVVIVPNIVFLLVLGLDIAIALYMPMAMSMAKGSSHWIMSVP